MMDRGGMTHWVHYIKCNTGQTLSKDGRVECMHICEYDIIRYLVPCKFARLAYSGL